MIDLIKVDIAKIQVDAIVNKKVGTIALTE
jgi:O-acetyl-ADP-ribose deacetylase (regulator of RNase III)